MATNNTTNQTEATMASKYSFASIKQLTYGVEIETYGLGIAGAARAIAAELGGTAQQVGGYYSKWTATMADGRKWTVMSDASISGHAGAEVVSPILKWDDMDLLQRVVRAVRRAGAKVNESCGIHVHVGAERFKRDPKALVRLAKIVHKHEDVLFEMLCTCASRRARWCRPVPATFLAKIEKYRGNSLDTLNRFWYGHSNPYPSHYDSSRYHALNLHNVWFRGTVEFRWYEASLHAGKVKAAVHLALGLAAKALETKSASSKKRPFDASRGKWDARTCLIRLGLIGEEFKNTRMHLTKHLQGDSRNAPAAQVRAAGRAA
jgi:hypothetical protein